MQVPAARHHVGQLRPAHEARVIALPAADLLHRAAEQHHGVGGREADLGLEGELALARPELDLDRAQRQTERHHVAADRLQHRLQLIEARLGEILIAGREHAHLRRLARPAGVGGIEPRILDLEHMEFDFETGDVVEAGIAEPVEHLTIEMARRERHRLAVLEIDVAQHPAGLRRPWQHAERGRVGDHQEIAAAFHLRHAEAAAGGEHREHGLVRGVLGEQRGGDRAAVAHHLGGVAGDDGLAAQDAVLVGKREPHDLEALLLDQPLGPRGGLELLLAPQTVALDEGLGGGAFLRRRHDREVIPSPQPGPPHSPSSVNALRDPAGTAKIRHQTRRTTMGRFSTRAPWRRPLCCARA